MNKMLKLLLCIMLVLTGEVCFAVTTNSGKATQPSNSDEAAQPSTSSSDEATQLSSLSGITQIPNGGIQPEDICGGAKLHVAFSMAHEELGVFLQNKGKKAVFIKKIDVGKIFNKKFPPKKDENRACSSTVPLDPQGKGSCSQYFSGGSLSTLVNQDSIIEISYKCVNTEKVNKILKVEFYRPLLTNDRQFSFNVANNLTLRNIYRAHLTNVDMKVQNGENCTLGSGAKKLDECSQIGGGENCTVTIPALGPNEQGVKSRIIIITALKNNKEIEPICIVLENANLLSSHSPGVLPRQEDVDLKVTSEQYIRPLPPRQEDVDLKVTSEQDIRPLPPKEDLRVPDQSTSPSTMPVETDSWWVWGGTTITVVAVATVIVAVLSCHVYKKHTKRSNNP